MSSYSKLQNECVVCGRKRKADGFCEVHSYELIETEWDMCTQKLMVQIVSVDSERSYLLEVSSDAFHHPRITGWGDADIDVDHPHDSSELDEDERRAVVSWCRKSTDVMNALRDAFNDGG
jgi:hypothetical protein